MSRVLQLFAAAGAGAVATYLTLLAIQTPQTFDDCLLANRDAASAGMVIAACRRKFPEPRLDFSAQAHDPQQKP